MDVERLRQLELFGDLDYHDLAQVARWVHEIHARPGDVLFEQDSLPFDVFVIESGTVEVLRDGESIAMLGPGDTVGEMALLRQQKRMATVRVSTPLTAVAIPAEDLEPMAAEMPEIVATLRAVMEERQRRNQDL
jgi:CRP/FNR family transcriptional regulator, cyclic AMP receptor protein